MKQSDIKLIKEMLEMQKELDKEIMESHKIIELTQEQLTIAMMDEVGELIHELKGNWCWWKFTQPEVDREKVLGELVDIWHFVLSFINNFTDKNYKHWNGWLEPLLDEEEIKKVSEWSRADKCLDTLVEYIKMLIEWSVNYGFRLAVLTEYLGFTIEDVYHAYMAKNKINHERVEQGY